ncbi:hypothetical protein BC739_001449 [Kutzneria viridogrisea]|uniref:Uncharacterized protein n=1 Tax=Kutzneria viridogrisea TaxID=47990 RepID=A0ABR6BBN3_9PSEU|nr:hypothetical protein [Kutzneria viridogrisea]
MLTTLRYSPSRATTIVQAILALHRIENPIYRARTGVSPRQWG